MYSAYSPFWSLLLVKSNQFYIYNTESQQQLSQGAYDKLKPIEIAFIL